MPARSADAEAATRVIIEILAKRDLDAVPAAVADEYVDHQGLGELEIRGPDGFRLVAEAVHHYSDVHVRIEDIVATNDKAAVRLHWSGTDASGGSVTRETLDLLRFVDGRLAEHWGAELSRNEPS